MSRKNFKLGEFIKSKREAKNISQEVLAGLIGVRQTDVSRWENNVYQPDTMHVIMLCNVLGLALSDLTREEARQYESEK